MLDLSEWEITSERLPFLERGFELVAPGGRARAVDDVLLLGRDEGCDLRLITSHVSRHHAAVFVHDGKLMVWDLGSSHGTHVNGRRVAHGELHAGDVLDVGGLEVVVRPAFSRVTPRRGRRGVVVNIDIANHAEAAASGGARVVAGTAHLLDELCTEALRRRSPIVRRDPGSVSVGFPSASAAVAFAGHAAHHVGCTGAARLGVALEPRVRVVEEHHRWHTFDC